VLLLGQRKDGSLYTQEEVEIARATGERIIDTASSLAVSQKLMQLQRERMASAQLLDQRTRRSLHDEVLPSVHAAMLALNAGRDSSGIVQQLSEVHQKLAELLHELPPTVAPEITRLGLIAALRRSVQVEFGQFFQDVQWDVEPGAEEQTGALSPAAAEVVYFAARELVRNAAKHSRPEAGPENRRLRIAARVTDGSLRIIVEDNGATWPAEPSGVGQGLSLHGTMMAVVGGTLSIERDLSATRGILSIPLQVS